MAVTKKKKITSISLGSYTELIDEIKTKEDRSRSAVIRRAIDYYYMMNYLPVEEVEEGDTKQLAEAKRDVAKRDYMTLKELKQNLHVKLATHTNRKIGKAI